MYWYRVGKTVPGKGADVRWLTLRIACSDSLPKTRKTVCSLLDRKRYDSGEIFSSKTAKNPSEMVTISMGGKYYSINTKRKAGPVKEIRADGSLKGLN